MTLLQIINRVLRRLREDEVTDFSDEYTMLLLDLLADIHEEVLDYHDWSLFDHEEAVNLVGGQAEYALTGTNLKSVLRYMDGQPLIYWFVDSLDSDGDPLQEISWEAYQSMYQGGRTEEQDQPQFVAFRQSGTGLTMAVWPAPINSGGIIRVHLNTPEATLDPDTALTTAELAVPTKPLIAGVLYLALNERGEEMGEPGNIAEQRYNSALIAAKEIDVMRSGRTNKLEFYRD